MTLDEICRLPVRELAADDAIMFLWVTAPKLEESFEVVHAWGFQYRTQMVWCKDKFGTGYYGRGQHENLLICRRGDACTPRRGETQLTS